MQKFSVSLINKTLPQIALVKTVSLDNNVAVVCFGIKESNRKGYNLILNSVP